MSAWVLADAVAVVARAETLMGVSMAAAAASRVAEPALLTRALEPALSWRQALIAGAHRRRRSVDGPASAASAWWRPALAVTLVALAVAASAALSGDGVAVVLLLGSSVVGIAAAVVWDYTATYERRKQQHLVASLRGRYATIVEVGCADGHNLEALAIACPEATVLGTDVSTRALDVARLRTRDVPNVRVVTSDEAAPELAVAAQPQCVVLAEVLYYLVTARAMRDALGPLVGAAGERRDVLMLHGAVDGRVLHRRAARALGLEIVHEDEVQDPIRPFILTLARTRSDGG